jgi:hypothetical protein
VPLIATHLLIFGLAPIGMYTFYERAPLLETWKSRSPFLALTGIAIFMVFSPFSDLKLPYSWSSALSPTCVCVLAHVFGCMFGGGCAISWITGERASHGHKKNLAIP